MKQLKSEERCVEKVHVETKKLFQNLEPTVQYPDFCKLKSRNRSPKKYLQLMIFWHLYNLYKQLILVSFAATLWDGERCMTSARAAAKETISNFE